MKECTALTNRKALLLAVRADDVKRRHRDGSALLRFLRIDDGKLFEATFEVDFLQHSTTTIEHDS